MSQGHWTKDEMIDQLYGLTERDPRHLEECGQCAAQWSAMLERRAQHALMSDEPAAFFAAERRRIYTQLGRAPHSARGLMWAPALGAAICLLAVALFVHHPKPVPPSVDAADAQFFSEVYSMEQSAEPRAAAPIHALFEGGQ